MVKLTFQWRGKGFYDPRSNMIYNVKRLQSALRLKYPNWADRDIDAQLSDYKDGDVHELELWTWMFYV